MSAIPIPVWLNRPLEALQDEKPVELLARGEYRRVAKATPVAVPSVAMTKAELHRLVDALPEGSWEAAATLLRRAQDPVAAKLDAAPYDDEDLTEEDLRAVREARAAPGLPWSEAERS